MFYVPLCESHFMLSWQNTRTNKFEPEKFCWQDNEFWKTRITCIRYVYLNKYFYLNIYLIFKIRQVQSLSFIQIYFINFINYKFLRFVPFLHWHFMKHLLLKLFLTFVYSNFWKNCNKFKYFIRVSIWEFLIFISVTMPLFCILIFL